MSTIEPLSQMDPRWKDRPLGQNTVTIGKYGCLLTSLAMVANYYGASETPDSLNDKMKAAGGFQEALVIPAVMPRAVPGTRYVKYVQSENQPAPLVEIDASLAAGKPVIVEVDYSPAPGLQNHWIVLYAKQGDDYLIRDPWPYPAESKDVLLTARYGFAGKPAQIIQGAIWLDGSGGGSPQPKAVPQPVKDTGFAVYAAADGLALRTQPFVADDNLIERLPLNTKFYVLEPTGDAQRKIGVVNQWLNVQETGQGYMGYVAAWYVSPQTQSAPPEPARPVETQTAGMHVFAAEDGLALRSQAQINDATLVKRLPLNAELVSQESDSQTAQKLGVTGQWLTVRDVEGSQGYVAAWYLSDKRTDEALGVQPKGSSPAPAPAGAASASLVVRVIEDGLALRSQPLISDATLVKRLPLNSELQVQEPAAQAKPKLGVVNQWLNVRDADNTPGYVAAWYVVERPQPAQV
jgi:Peptidase_C39 like family